MSHVIIEIRKSDFALFEHDIREALQDIKEIEAARLDGTSVIQILTVLNVAAIPAIARILTTIIESKRHVVVKKNGIEIRGLNGKDAAGIIEKLKENV